MSAVRVSPPQSGPAHSGKVVGRDIVKYTYNQVRLSLFAFYTFADLFRAVVREQSVPIPSYLIAIAAGNVVYKPFPKPAEKTWSTGVWAEPELIEASYWEFKEDTARYLFSLFFVATYFDEWAYGVVLTGSWRRRRR